MKAITILTFIVSLVILGLLLYQEEFVSNRKNQETIKEKNSQPGKDLKPFVTVKIMGSVDPDDAAVMTDLYRAALSSTDTKLIWHSIDDIKSYVDNIFNKYTPKVAPPAGYSWRVALNPMQFMDPYGKKKVTICILPILVDKANEKNGFDYFNEKKGATTIYTKYFKPLNDLVIADGFKSFIFDEGHLWP